VINTVSENDLALPSKVLQKRFILPQSDSYQTETNKQLSGSYSYAFRVGDLGLLLESQKVVSEVIDALPMCTIPNAPPWLYSMANLRGNITPIFNLADIFGYKNLTTIEHKKILIIGEKDQAVGIHIDEVPFRVTLTDNDEVDVLADLPQKLSPHIRKCYEQSNTIWIDWDVFGFFNTLKMGS